MSRKAQGKKMHKDLDPGRKEAARAKRQARERGNVLHRRGPSLYRQPKP